MLFPKERLGKDIQLHGRIAPLKQAKGIDFDGFGLRFVQDHLLGDAWALTC